jgi:hypothetical protein
MGKYFRLLDADLSKYKLGRWYGDGRYEEEIQCEGIYLYTPIGSVHVIAAVVKQNLDLFSQSKYDLYFAHDLNGRFLSESDFVVFANPEKIKRVNICLTLSHDTRLRIVSRQINRSRSEIIRDALDEYLERYNTQAQLDYLPVKGVV